VQNKSSEWAVVAIIAVVAIVAMFLIVNTSSPNITGAAISADRSLSDDRNLRATDSIRTPVPIQSTCLGDLNSDNVVDASDLSALLEAWGACTNCPADLNNDNIVDISDLLLLLGNWGPCTNEPDSLQEGLISHYTFTGNNQDTSGNNNHALPSGNVQYGPGAQEGQALLLQGNGYVEAPHSADLSITEQLSLSLWIRPTTFDEAWQAIVGKGDNTYQLRRYQSTNRIVMTLRNSGVSTDVITNANIPLNQWTHIAATYDGSIMKIYVNGELDNQVSRSGTIGSNTLGLQIGVNTDGNTYRRHFKGSIDEVRIYDRALTTDEVLIVAGHDVPEPQDPVCGDGVVNQAWEECDGNDFASTSCYNLGYTGGGSLSCTQQCTIDASECQDGGDLDMASSISQHGITWTFDQEYPVGQFINGDWWVIGPVTITSITPGFNGANNGWEVNPDHIVQQGFDTRIANFNADRVPSLPYTSSGEESIVKSVSLQPFTDNSCRPCLYTAAVLTVLTDIPPDKGSTVFRPPYFGDDKMMFSIHDLRTDLLPSLPRPGNAMTLNAIASNFERVQLDHKTNWVGRHMHPQMNLPDYGSSIASRNAIAAVSLMLDDSIDAKMPALINYVQGGIDWYGILHGGGNWQANGGHLVGRKLPVVFAAVILDDENMKTNVAQAIESRNIFDEDMGMVENSDGISLYGQINMDLTDFNYWRTITIDLGSRTIPDPYGLIDGGLRPGSSYQYCCLSKPWKGSALAIHLMPELETLWNNDDFVNYVDRWVEHGTWTQPDVCAPADGVCSGGSNSGQYCNTAGETGSGNLQCPGGSCDLSVNWPANYGVTYGLDSSTGFCILDTDPSDGIGRFPLRHGTFADEGHYNSQFIDDMWSTYR